jgi:hypothetical protein
MVLLANLWYGPVMLLTDGIRTINFASPLTYFPEIRFYRNKNVNLFKF